MPHFMFGYARPADIEEWLVQNPLDTAMLLSQDKENRTPLMTAAMNDNIDAVKAVLKSEHCTAEVLLAKDKRPGNTALHYEIIHE